MGHIDRKQRNRELVRAGILEAALRIAETEGWQAVTIRRISEAIEYTTSIVYSHFESKEALLQEIVNGGFKILNEEGEKILTLNLEPKEQLLRMSLVNWDFANKYRELYFQMFSAGKPNSDQATKGMKLLKQIFVTLTGVDEEQVGSLILNWICVRQGSINFLMNASKEHVDADGRQLYVEFMSRFIDSIAKK